MKHKSETSGEEMAWLGPTLQFVFGAVVGGLVGVGLYAEFFDAAARAWLIIPGSAVVCGTLASVFGDRFWHGWFGGPD